IEPVELSEHVDVVDRVRGVAVDHEGCGREPPTDRLDRLEIPAWLDLDLHAPVPVRQVTLAALEELTGRRIDADRHPRRKGARAPSEKLVQRPFFGVRTQIPEGPFETRLRERLTWKLSEQSPEALEIARTLAQERRRERLGQRMPGRVGRFGRVEGASHRRGLADAHAPVALDRHEHDVLLVAGAAGDRKGLEERDSAPPEEQAPQLYREALLAHPPRSGAAQKAAMPATFVSSGQAKTRRAWQIQARKPSIGW